LSKTSEVILSGRRIEITPAKREKILSELPEAALIGDAALRTRVLDAWAAALEFHNLESIGSLRPSGNFDTAPLRSGTQADHLRSVCRLSLKTADEMTALFPAFGVDRDILVAGALCHDIGKVWEFHPDNLARWRKSARATGLPSVRHPGYGVFLCLSAGLPEAIAHIAGGHSAEGDLITRSLENTIIHWADVTFWKVAEAGDQFVPEVQQAKA
jgi:hypothetical protein